MSASRSAQLASLRARWPQLDDRLSAAVFGVGVDTLQRIESGEVEPEPDVAERIDLFLQKNGGAGALSFHPARPGDGGSDDGESRAPAAALRQGGAL